MRLALALAAGTLAATTLGLTTAHAQSAPPVGAPYYIVDAGESALAMASGGSIRKSGNIATITVVMGSHPDQMANAGGIARMDMAYEFNCANSTYRTPVAAAYDADGDLMDTLADDSPWEAVAPDSNNWMFKRIACDGIYPDDVYEGEDLAGVIAIYREWVVNP